MDEVERVEKEYFKVGSLERTISKNEYNYKDQLIRQYQGETANGQTGVREYAQKIDYSYRQDGLLEKINDNILTGSQVTLGSCTNLNPGTPGTSDYDQKHLFYSILHYDNPIGSATSQENGNISNVQWQIRGRYQQMYAYEYDEYNRLTEANYYDYTGSAWSSTGIFDTDYAYDARGNFTDVERDGKKPMAGCFSNNTIDDLSYNYYSNSNELEYVNDNADNNYGFKETTTGTGSYTYDSNGNMITDSEKGFTSITYNHLNLPVTVTKSAQSIEFTYDAAENLLNKKQKNGAIVIEDRDYEVLRIR